MLLNKNNFNDCVKRKTAVVSCDDFDVKIQSLLIEDQLQIEKLSSSESTESQNIVFLMLKLSCVDEDGNNIITDANVKQLPASAALQIFNECLALNGLSDTALEEKAKNF